MPVDRSPVVVTTFLAAVGLMGMLIYGFMPVRPAAVEEVKAKAPAIVLAPPPPSAVVEKPWPVIDPPRPYLTQQIETYVARDKCSITKQRCRKDGVCMTCFVCPYNGRDLLGTSFTKCKNPLDCIELADNVAWTREKVDPGWCEGMPFKEVP